MKKNKVIGMIIILALTFFVGFVVGYASAIKLCVKIATQVLDINIDPKVMEQLIYRYGAQYAH